MTREAERTPPSSALSPDGTFPRASRVRHRREFTRIQTSGVRVRSKNFTVVALLQGLGHARLGCAISKRVGNAVVRNRIRRRLRETFRRMKGELPSVDFVVIAHPPAAGLAERGLARVQEEVVPLLREAGTKAQKRGAR